MITFSCPGCQATFKLPDEMAGKSAKCSKCGHRFSVPANKPQPAPAPAAAPRAAPAAAPAAKPAPAKKVPLTPVKEVLEAEVLEAEVVEEATPPRPPAAPPRRAAVVDEVEVIGDAIQEPGRPSAAIRDTRFEEDEGLPPRRRRRAEDDWDDDLPRRPRRKSGSLGVILACVGGGSFVLMFVCMIGMIVAAPRVVVLGGGQPNFNAPIFQPPPNVQQPPPNQNPGPAAAANLVNGVFEAQGELTPNDPQDNPGQNFQRQGARAKRYDIQLEAGKTYIIEMVQTNLQQNFDPYLRLEQNGMTLAEDDDGAGDLNARIVFRPTQTGRYTIVATSLGQLFGSYRLTVRAN